MDPTQILQQSNQSDDKAANTPPKVENSATPASSDATQDDPQIRVQHKVKDATTTAVKTTNALNPNSEGSEDTKPINAPTPGESQDEVIAEIEDLQRQVNESVNMPPKLREKANRSIERLRRMARRGSYTGEFETIEKYIYWITEVPWGVYTTDNLDISNAKRIMDQSHYGIGTVKNMVLDYLAVMKLKLDKGEVDEEERDIEETEDMAVLRGSSANAPVMLFVGLQGVGKTSIAKSIANSMGRKFQRVSIGAIGSVQALRGQSKAFLDAEPGWIIKAIARAGTMNPVILLDEIDKTSGQSGLLNDVMAALLEILDPEQNSTFIDHYIDYPVDLSKVYFIATANNLGTLSAALLDRVEVIRFVSYTDEEKIVIAKNYSMPKVMKSSGLDNDDIVIKEEVWPILVRPVGYDAGLRQLERNLATMVRAAARRIVHGEAKPIVITPENIREFVLPDQGPLS